jgi:hypothetical protein
MGARCRPPIRVFQHVDRAQQVPEVAARVATALMAARMGSAGGIKTRRDGYFFTFRYPYGLARGRGACSA